MDAPADRAQARALADAAQSAARRPGLYGEGRVTDDFSGRFEMAALYAIILTRRIGAGREAQRLAQAVSNRIFQSFDEALREAGEGDLSVAKRMKALARAFYGRLQSYERALDAADPAALAAALSRNIWDQDDAPFAAPLAAHIIAVDRALAGADLFAMAAPAAWPPPPQ
jgi:cytochrome b pre-mRNA-processing protein 3